MKHFHAHNNLYSYALKLLKELGWEVTLDLTYNKELNSLDETFYATKSNTRLSAISPIELLGLVQIAACYPRILKEFEKTDSDPWKEMMENADLSHITDQQWQKLTEKE